MKTLVGLDGSELRTIYPRPWSIWKERVNYKQQGPSTICSALNDVILTLKLPETHFTKECILCYDEGLPLCFEHGSSLVCMPSPFTSSPWEPFAFVCQNSSVLRPPFKKLE
ncbi:Hypothetical predicted protein [Podarcis lilfordi]|uniref:Uncharacterized protein n=1 Tax=Podarcis lilfordi TaxID=74358 RepID=A0AA35KX36_9SAUR|nr:Hypothetical predicted protein [Podarcis lilfordi]